MSAVPGMIWLPGRTRRFYALIANYSSSTVTPLDLTNPLAPIASAAVAVGANPTGISISPNGLFALVANFGSSTVTPLDLTNPLAPVASAAVVVGASPFSIGNFIYIR
jgi:DNA-binding beta-propeller fold protein YncE